MEPLKYLNKINDEQLKLIFNAMGLPYLMEKEQVGDRIRFFRKDILNRSQEGKVTFVESDLRHAGFSDYEIFYYRINRRTHEHLTKTGDVIGLRANVVMDEATPEDILRYNQSFQETMTCLFPTYAEDLRQHKIQQLKEYIMAQKTRVEVDKAELEKKQSQLIIDEEALMLAEAELSSLIQQSPAEQPTK